MTESNFSLEPRKGDFLLRGTISHFLKFVHSYIMIRYDYYLTYISFLWSVFWKKKLVIKPCKNHMSWGNVLTQSTYDLHFV